jgi:hypothetical protein
MGLIGDLHSTKGSFPGRQDVRDLPSIIRSLIAAPRVGTQAQLPTLDQHGAPILSGKRQAIWDAFLTADRVLAESEGRGGH